MIHGNSNTETGPNWSGDTCDIEGGCPNGEQHSEQPSPGSAAPDVRDLQCLDAACRPYDGSVRRRRAAPGRTDGYPRFRH